jgi:predicted cation transporter
MADYLDIYYTHFFTTLGQLSAGLVSSMVIVPMYQFYTIKMDAYKKYQLQELNRQLEEVIARSKCN